jgi:hypothetical protein
MDKPTPCGGMPAWRQKRTDEACPVYRKIDNSIVPALDSTTVMDYARNHA